MKKITFLLIFLMASAVLTAQVPENDACTGAISIADGDDVTVDTTDATEDNAECSTSATSKGVWYVFNDGGTPAVVTLDLSGSDFDTEVSIFSGSCDALVCLGNNDDGGTGTTSLITFLSDGASDYFILATGFSANTGMLNLVVTTNTPLENDNCSGAIAVTNGDSIESSTEIATADNAECSTSTSSAGVWYFINDGGTAIDVTIDTNGSSFDTELSYFTGTCDALVCAGNDDDGGDGSQSLLTFTTSGDGENIYILATGFGSNSGDLIVNVTGEGLLSTDTPSNELNAFTMFPNPVRETLSISNGSTINNVKVFNLLGQKVLDQKIGATSEQLNVSNLKTGAYLIQVTAEGQTGTYKFIKQ